MSRTTKAQSDQDTDIVRQILENMSLTAMATQNIVVEASQPPQRSNEPRIKREVGDLLKRFEEGKEIEASFGAFEDKRFVPGVTRQAFLRILDLFDFEKPERDITYVSRPLQLPPTHRYANYSVRKVETENFGAPRYELKRRVHFLPDEDNGYRITESLEITQVDQAFIEDYIKGTVGLFQTKRERERVSCEVGEVVRVDLTKVLSNQNYIYEVEVEIIQKTQQTLDVFFEVVDQILSAINPPGGLSCISKDRTQATVDLNRILRPNEPASTHFRDTSLVRPVNLTIDDLLTNVFPALTLKLDGYRAILYASREHGVFMYVQGEAVFMAEPSSEIIGTFVIDGEYYEKKLYAFDCIYANNPIFALDFKSRYESLRSAVEKLNALVPIEMKKYYFSDNVTDFYANMTEVYAECITDEEKYDGIIFQPLGGYYDREPRKWKPSERQTADFKVEAMQGGYKLLVTQTMGSGDYKIVPFSRVSYPIDIIDAPDDIDGRIAEILVKKEGKEVQFEFKKFRDEKSRPNAIFTVEDVWRDIQKPIKESTLTGFDTVLMRRYFNLEKKRIIDQLFTKLGCLGDVGSGQGGDISKWIDASIKDVQCYDVDPVKIDEFKRRLAVSKPKDTKIQIHRIGFEQTRDVISSLKGKVLDGIAAFFSLTFFGSDEQKMDAVVDTISKTLRTGSFFTGMVFDGQKVREYMKDKAKVEKYKDVIRIEGDYTNKPFGNSVIVNLGYGDETYIKDVNEYLFPFDKFEEKLLNAGFQKVSEGIMDGYASIPPAGQEWVAMNRQFTFVKGEFKTQKLGFSFEDIGFSVVNVPPGPDNLFEALSKVLGDIDPSNMRKEMAKYSIVEWKKLDGGQLAGGYQQVAIRKVSSSVERRKAMEHLGVKKLGPNEYALLGYDLWHTQISDPNEVVGPRLGVELLSKLLDVGIVVYNQLGKVEHIYFRQKEAMSKYSRKVNLLYDGVSFSALIPFGYRADRSNVLVPNERMAQYENNPRTFANYLKKMSFPYIGSLIPIDRIREYSSNPVVITKREWKINGQVIPKNVKVLQFEKADDLPRYFDSASDPFMENRRLTCKVKTFPSPLEYWNNGPVTVAKQLIDLWKIERRDITVEDAHDALYRAVDVRVCTEFHLSYAMGVMSYLAPKKVDPQKVKVLDPCAGHGARLIAALKLGFDYTACDPDLSLRKGHEGIIKTFLKPGYPAPKIYYEGAEVVEFGSKIYDLVFTSPPYFDFEIYSEAGTQSIFSEGEARSYQDWEREFLQPMLEHSWEALKRGGYLAIHIQDVTSGGGHLPLISSTRKIADKLPGSNFAMLFALRGDSGKDRPVWVWNKN